MLDKIGAGLQKLSKFVGIFNDDWADAMRETGEGLQDTAADILVVDKTFVKLANTTTTVVKKTKPLPKVLEKTSEAVEETVDEVQNLIDAWTGATLKSDKFLRAFKKLTPEQKKNDRIMDKVLDKYHDMREILGPFNEELEEIWRTTRRLNPSHTGT